MSFVGGRLKLKGVEPVKGGKKKKGRKEKRAMGLNIPHRTLVMPLLRSAVTALRLSHMPCVMARAPRAVFCCLLLSRALRVALTRCDPRRRIC